MKQRSSSKSQKDPEAVSVSRMHSSDLKATNPMQKGKVAAINEPVDYVGEIFQNQS